MGSIQWLTSIKYFLYVRHYTRYFALYSSLQSYVLTPKWPNEDGGWRERKKIKRKKLFSCNSKNSGKWFSLLLTLRSQCHFGEPVPNGPVRNGGFGLTKDPAAPLHRAHGGPGLQAATGPWWRDLHAGECHCLCFCCMAALLGLAGEWRTTGRSPSQDQICS